MMRRFSRRHRGGASDTPINGEASFARMRELGVLELRSLEVLPAEKTSEVPASYAAIGIGEDEKGERVLVSFAPRSAGDALLGGLIVASKLAGDEDSDGEFGELIVVAPHWTLAARRRFLVGPKSYRVRAIAAPALSDSAVSVQPEAVSEPGVVTVAAVANHLTRPADRALFVRATAALEGLASKHGGAIRGFERSVELVIMARRVAELRADESGVLLNTVLPTRSTLRLSADDLASALDTLEGNLRKRLNDRRAREGDEGVRTRLQPLVASVLELRSLVCWPVGGKDLDVIDTVGVNPEGSPVATAARSSLSLAALGVILDAALELRASLPVVLARAEAPVRLDLFRLALIAREFAPGVARVMPLLNLSHDLIEIRSNSRDRSLEVSVCGSGEAVPISTGRGRRGRGAGGSDRARRGRRDAAGDEAEASENGEATGVEAEAVGATGGGRSAGSGTSSGRSRRRGRRSGGGDRDAAADSAGAVDAKRDGAEKPARPRPQFEEMSSFDLAEEDRSSGSNDEGTGGRSKKRGRRPRGRRRGGAQQAEDDQDSPVPAATDSGNTEGRAGGRKPRAAAKTDGEDGDSGDVVDADEFLEETLSELPDSVEAIGEAQEPRYDDDEDEDESGQRKKPQTDTAEQEKPVEAPKPVRRRVAIVAHADRDSVLAAVLLARELRLVEGIWVYTQAELMTFFRGVATDLRDETPIYVVGFTPSPARDVIQAAAIYAGRLTWVDHRSWPPEDLGGLREALGEDYVWVAPGLGTSLPLMLTTFTRRSRFSDKLVDLAAGRFTEHDYERWGRVWWWRLGEIAKQSGSRKSELEPLLSGRPSDLAKEAETAEVPPPPPEVEFVSGRDFRLVHFAGHGMVILEVPEELDLNLAARVARERYRASLSLVTREGSETVILAGDEGTGRRTLDFSGLVDHLADKLEWVESLPNHDHVARFVLRDRQAHPDRLDDVIGEIVMGRSLLER
ncbi:MAG: hypothetical protein JRG89_15500 [Deltaproteobacteria bacterium]|nr:hypothetical protein [Deltaproteobacteria bacterium]